MKRKRPTVSCTMSGLMVMLLVMALRVPAAEQTSQDYIHYRLGIKYKNEGNVDKAIEEFRKVLAAYPDNYNAYMHLAEIRTQQNMPRLAIYNLEKALSYNPRWSKAYRMLAEVYEQDGRLQKAIMQLQSYQQVCDPAQADSVQKKIDALIARLSGEQQPAGESGPASDAATSQTQKQPQTAASSTEAAAAQTDARGAPAAADKGGPAPHTVAAHEPSAFKKAVAAYKNGTYEQALQHIHDCLDANPGHSGAYYYAGLIRRRWNQDDMARVNFEKALSYPQLGHNAHFYLGKIYGEQKQYAQAIDHLKAYISKTDYMAGRQEAQKLIERYRPYCAQKDTGMTRGEIEAVATQAMQQEIERIPRKKDYESMEIRIDSLLTLSLIDTFTPPGHAMLDGVRLFEKGLYEKAIEVFKKMQLDYAHNDVAATCIYNIGICNCKLGLFTRAAAQFQQLRNRFPSSDLVDEARFFNAYAHAQKGEYSIAQKLFREFVRAYEDHRWRGKAYEKMGDSYRALEQKDKAVDAYTKAVDAAASVRDEVYALYKLGAMYAEMDNAQRMMRVLEKAVKKGEAHGIYERVPDSYYKMADYYYRNGDYEKALSYYTTVSRTYPQFHEMPWALFQIGNIHKRKGRYEQAIETYRLLQDKYPDDYWAREAKWKIQDTIWENEYQAILRNE